jgi:hypothetical protein
MLRRQTDVYGFLEIFADVSGWAPRQSFWNPACHRQCIPDMTLAMGGRSCAMAISAFRKSSDR